MGLTGLFVKGSGERDLDQKEMKKWSIFGMKKCLIAVQFL